MTALDAPPRTTRPRFHRGRRLRRTPALRALVRETRLHPAMLVAPLFVGAGIDGREAIAALPGQHRYGIDGVVREVERLAEVGVRSVLLFGLPEAKDAEGSGAWIEDGVTQRAIRAIRASLG
ncbi:MAG TPA: hypothetical protein VFM19_01920, partial [Candidatus Limnocylindria bacterium]|nr:hypothetical protein [Candidatus Limnocylindria bacterium]